MKKLTTEEFIKKARKIHGNKYDYSKVIYVNNRTKVCIICPIHGEFWQTPTNHLKGQGCYKCSKISMGNKQRITENDLRERLEKVFGDKYDLSDLNYIDYKHKVKLKCPKHGEFMALPSNLLKGHGCKKCALEKASVNKSMSKQKFKELADLVHNHKYIYTKSDTINRNNDGKVCIICPIHGEFWQTPSNHIHGKQGCPKCKSSKLELEVINLLESSNIKYEYQKHFNWLGKQSLDFYLPKYNIAIECQGEQHFIGSNFGSKKITDEDSLMLVKKRDETKYKVCKEHNIEILYYSNKDYEDNIICDKNKLLKEINQYGI